AFAAKTFAQLEILQAALPHLGRTGSATLVTVASAQAALPSTAGLATYFARTAQRLPVGHIGQPADVAAAVALLIGNGFVTGHVLVADGGAHLAR
ncbi:MAG TPA: hypothetical protein VKP11_02820, partial [Frankiaceae bacterium]|nr:hypothetical protein [Frankiaceae bacterium]